MRKDNLQAVFNILAQLLLNGTNFILIMIFTRYLNTGDYGIVSIFQAYALFFTAIVGLNVQGSIGTAFVYFEENERKNYLASILLLALVFFFVMVLVVFLFIKPFSNFSELSPMLIYLMLIYSFGAFCFQFANIKYVYQRKSQFSCIMALIVAVGMILLSWIGIRNQETIGFEPSVIRILSLSGPYIVCGLYVIISIFIQGNPFASLKRYLTFCLPICIPLVFHAISQIVLGQTDKVMIQKLLADNSLVGLYSFTVTFVHIMNSIYTALNNTWVPIYYEYIKMEHYEDIERRANNYSNLFLILSVGFMLIAPELIKVFADRAYWGGISLIPYIVPAVFFSFQYSFAVNFELYHRKSKWIALGTMGAAAANIVFNWVLIPHFGLVGEAVATLLSYVLLFVFHQICALLIKGDRKYTFNAVFFVKRIIPMIAMSVLFVLIQDLIIVRWFLAAVVCVVLILRTKKINGLF